MRQPTTGRCAVATQKAAVGGSPALEIATEEPQSSSRASALAAADMLAYWQGDLNVAKWFHEENLTIRRKIGDTAGIAASLSDLGSVEGHNQNTDTSLQLINESLAILGDSRDKWDIHIATQGLASLAFATKAYPPAAQLRGASERLRADVGSPMQEKSRIRCERESDAAHAALANDADFDIAWKAGYALGDDEILKFASDI